MASVPVYNKMVNFKKKYNALSFADKRLQVGRSVLLSVLLWIEYSMVYVVEPALRDDYLKYTIIFLVLIIISINIAIDIFSGFKTKNN